MKMKNCNMVDLVGYVGTAPASKVLANGTLLVRARMATTPPGDKEPQWHTIVAWGERLGGLLAACSKGTKLRAQGRVDKRTWEKDGKPRQSVEIVAHELETSPAAEVPQRNKVVLVGHLARHAFVGFNPATNEYEAALALATNRNWKDRSGTWKTSVTYHEVRISGETAAELKGLRAGTALGVEGRLVYHNFQAVVMTPEVMILTPDAQQDDMPQEEDNLPMVAEGGA